MKWLITKDFCDAGRAGTGNVSQRLKIAFGALSQETTEPFITSLMKSGMPYRFRLYDDDGNLNFEGIASECGTEAAFEPLDWAMADVGSTRIDYLQPNGKWEAL